MLAARHDYAAWTKRITPIDRIIHTDAAEPSFYEGEVAAPSPAGSRHDAGGAGGDPAPDGGGRRRGGRLDGRRHAGRRAVRALPRAAPLFPPGVQPGHQPADRQPARDAGHVAQDPARQPRQRAGRERRAVRPAATGEPRAVHRRVPGDADVHGDPCLRDRLHRAHRGRRHRPARRAGAHPARGGGGRARRLHPRHRHRRAPDRRARRHPDDPGHGGDPHAFGAPVAAHLHQPERARGGVRRRARLRGADRRGRHHDQRLPGAGEHRRPPPPRVVRRHVADLRGAESTRRRSTRAC